jgi:hypothetical protein
MSKNTQLGNLVNGIFVDSTGKVGVGTESPASKFSVNTGGSNQIAFVNNATSGGTYNIISLNGSYSEGTNMSIQGGGVGDANLYVNSGFTSSTSGAIIFRSGGASVYTERMRISAAGNVGIGTTNPSSPNLRLGEKLAIVTVNDYGGLSATTYAGASGGRSSVIDLQKSRGSSDGSMTAVANGDEVGYLIFRGSDGTNFVDGALIRADVDGTVSSGSVPMTLKIFTGGANERMRITSAGNVNIGVNTSTSIGSFAALSVKLGTGGNLDALAIKTGQNGLNTINWYNESTTYVSSIVINASSVSYNTSSDYRLKTDLKPFSGLDLVYNINVYDFAWKSDGTRTHGVLAHELQEVLPNAVSGVKDAIDENGDIKNQGVDYSKLVPVLVKAIQELSAEINILKNK